MEMILIKRNFDLIRHILLVTENSNKNVLTVEDFVTDEYAESEIAYHIALLIDANYLVADETKFLRQKHSQYRVKRLTFSGSEYLDHIRNNSIWAKTKETILKAGSILTFETISKVAPQIALTLINNSLA